MRVYWHDEALAPRHGRGDVRPGALAADRGPRAAPRERRAHPQHPLGAARTARSRRTSSGTTAATPPSTSSSSCTTADYVRSVQAACAAAARPDHPVDAGRARRRGGRPWPPPARRLRPTEAVLDGAASSPTRSCARRATTPSRRTADGYCLFSQHRARARELARTPRARAGRDRRLGRAPRERHPGAASGTAPTCVAISLHMHHGSWGPHHPQTGAPGRARRAARAWAAT